MDIPHKRDHRISVVMWVEIIGMWIRPRKKKRDNWGGDREMNETAWVLEATCV